MKRWLAGAALWAAATVAAAAAPAHGLIVKLKDAAPNEIAQRLGGREHPDNARWRRVLAATGAAPRELRPHASAAQVLDFGRVLSADEAQAARLREQPEVEWVEPNVREHRLQQAQPNDPLFAGFGTAQGQWWLFAA